MASDFEYVAFIIEQLRPLGHITYRRMMGEYIIYYKTKYLVTVADNEVYLKVTDKVLPYLKEEVYKPFYKGGKPALLIRDVDDSDYLCNLVLITYNALITPKGE